MSKNIVFCADGSWSHPNMVQDGSYRYPGKAVRPDQAPIDVEGTTNVFKFYDALTASPNQVAFYDDGVGTHGFWLQRLEGGALGEGLFEKIKDGYSNIAQTYEDGDAIHLFGFSRGAYTVRSLAGMIAVCGIPDRSKMTPDMWTKAVENSFAAYRERDPYRKAELLAQLEHDYGNRKVKIAQLGVWDTVGAMGIPGSVFKDVNRARYGFLDTKLHPDVGAAWHAMAIDEHRGEFGVTPFSGPFAPGQKVDQVWFAGTHGDVGGGTEDPALADIPLGWMMKKALSQGLDFDPVKLARYTDLSQERALNTIHSPRSLLWTQGRVIPRDATIAGSVVTRLKEIPDYRPKNLHTSQADRVKGHVIPATMQVEEVMAPPTISLAR